MILILSITNHFCRQYYPTSCIWQ